MTDVLIKRELLEDAALWLEAHSPGSGSAESFTAQDIRAILAAPRQPEGEGLEVVVWLGGNGFHTEEKEATGAPFPLCHLSDAKRAIAERDATIERLEAGIPRIQEQSHQMRLQRDNLAGLLDRAVTEVGKTITPELRERIDAALSEPTQ